jgi:hypothetical protein
MQMPTNWFFLFVLFLALLLLFATIAYLWRSGKRVFAAIVLALATFAVIGVAFVFVGLPDVAGIIEEHITISMLNNHADQDALQGWFRRAGANWHMGQGWQSGESYTSPPAPCAEGCTKIMQVAFTNRVGLCEIFGDRITMRFDPNRKLKSWSVEAAADGC